ncbi:MAG: transglycosylase family protein, partial [Microthrixaceae bacterium]
KQKMLKAAAEQQARAEAERQRALGETRSAGAGSTGAPSGSVPAPGATGIAGDPTSQELAILAKIRRCESRGNYSITSPSGKYRGAYQFDRRTWAGVGGSGDPAAAPPYEQDYRALVLYRSRGGRPWPNCS